MRYRYDKLYTVYTFIYELENTTLKKMDVNINNFRQNLEK
jgi:hypothetical protein